jgi:8-oxo-dGTP diphosphatase
MKHIEVVAAVIIVDTKILCVQRNKTRFEYTSYRYEFPGGKVEKHETPEQALRREIREELLMDISIQRPFMTTQHTYPDFKLTLHSYICTCPTRELTLTEHIDAKWMNVDLIATLDWAEADIPVVDKIVYEAE